MFDIQKADDGTVRLIGRLDAAQVPTADAVMDHVDTSCRIDFSGLDYISSAGLGVLLKTQQRLGESGGTLTLTGLNPHIKLVFEYAGFDLIFSIE